MTCINPSIFSLIGLCFDIVGFTLISLPILFFIPNKINKDSTETVADAFGEELFTIQDLKKDIKVNIGFWLVILGFIFQLVGTLLSII